MFSVDNMKMVLNMQKHCCTAEVKKADGLEVKSGNLLMVQCCNGKVMKVPVIVRVYQNCFEHYAIIYRDSKYTNSAVFVSLKHCKVYRNDNDENEIKIVPSDIEGSSFTFQVNKTQEVNEWLSALEPEIPGGSPPKGSMSPSFRRTPLMPALQESLEEVSEEEEDAS